MSGITIARNRTRIYAYCTNSIRLKDVKNPISIKKQFGIVPLGTNNIIFNSFGMAILNKQGITLESLDNKYIK
jgi:hypothetical protein